MAVDSSRVYVQEGAYTARADRLDGVLLELFAHTTGQDVFTTITRTGGLISQIEYFTDAGRTTLDHKCTYTRTTGSDGVDYITGMVAIFYQSDGVTEDSRVTVTVTRNSEDQITSCDSVFSTSEDTKL